MTIESPCVQRCEIDAVSNRCLGCARSLQEIASWSRFSPAERRRIMNELPARMITTNSNPGGVP